MLIQGIGKGVNGQTGYASAISLVLFLLTLVPLAVIGIANNGDQFRELRANRRAKKIIRERARGTAPAVPSGAAMVSVGVPASAGELSGTTTEKDAQEDAR